MGWGLALLVVGGVLVLVYWLLIMSEGVYLGRNMVIKLYDISADSYDRLKEVMPHEDAEYLAQPLLDALAGIESPRILDVATGTARLPLALFRQWSFGGRVIGLDLSSGMLAVARERTESLRDRFALVQQDAVALPFPNESFDAVTCLEALEFLPAQAQALREMVRVLRPGGHVLLSNRVGIDAWFFPGRARSNPRLAADLRSLELEEIGFRRWQPHYDLVDARKRPPV